MPYTDYHILNHSSHLEANIPEGLQYQSADNIASFIASQGFNMVRLTYSIDMALSPDTLVSDSFNNAATATGVPEADIQAVYNNATTKNGFLSTATLIQAYDNVVQALATHNIMVVLDNQVSKASWCCSETDGNGWWDAAPGYDADNSRYFNTNNWVSGLSAMASWAKSHSNIVGISIRNELRAAGGQNANDWYTYVPQGANAIHSANSDLLITIGGVNYATDSSFLYNNPLDTSGWAGKTVWEVHEYPWSDSKSTNDCPGFETDIGNNAGFLLEQDKPFTGPLWLSEFGLALSGGSDSSGLAPSDHAYLDCIVQYMTGNDADWAMWALQGSYYVRDGDINKEETFGVYNADWSAPRNLDLQSLLGGMLNITQGP